VNNSEKNQTLKSSIDQKIVAAFERISQALRAMSWSYSKSLSLNPAQTQVLVFLYGHPKLFLKISLLAKEFGITNATMSDTVRLLEEKQLVRKTLFVQGSRNYFLSLTDKGKDLAKLASSYTHTLTDILKVLPISDSEGLLGSLSNIIYGLYKSGVSPVQRMCKTCKFHNEVDGTTYCHLLKKPLDKTELQIDCADHVQLQSYHIRFSNQC